MKQVNHGFSPVFCISIGMHSSAKYYQWYFFKKEVFQFRVWLKLERLVYTKTDVLHLPLQERGKQTYRYNLVAATLKAHLKGRIKFIQINYKFINRVFFFFSLRQHVFLYIK